MWMKLRNPLLKQPAGVTAKADSYMGAKLQAAFLTQALRWDPNNSEQSPVWLERQNKQLLVEEKKQKATKLVEDKTK